MVYKFLIIFLLKCSFLSLNAMHKEDTRAELIKAKVLESFVIKSVQENNLGQLARLLQENSAATNIKDMRGRTPMHIAAETNNANAIKLLIESGALINIENNQGLNPAEVAYTLGNPDALQIILHQSPLLAQNLDITVSPAQNIFSKIKTSLMGPNRIKQIQYNQCIEIIRETKEKLKYCKPELESPSDIIAREADALYSSSSDSSKGHSPRSFVPISKI